MYKRRIDTQLKSWMQKSGRKPLLLRGARQVGKTSTALAFGNQCFEHVFHINLDKAEDKRLFKGSLSLPDFLQILQIKFNQKIVPGKSLLFIDEIQNSPQLISLLRFLYEESPELHVMAAGSLLEVMIEKEGFSFPVGRIESLYLYPLDFFEFLNAIGENSALHLLQTTSINDSIPEGLHHSLLKLFHTYTMIGGMPEIVQAYIQDSNIIKLKSIYESLLTGYSEDVYKYSTHASSKYLSFILEHAPLYAGMTIGYDKFGGSNYRSREMSNAFSTLEKTMLLHQISATKSIELPLIKQPKRLKKLLYLDTGLVNYRMGIQSEFTQLQDLNSLYRGRLAEQIVGQNIIAQYSEELPQLMYWAKDKSEGAAEVDFCMQHEGNLVGIEVKSGTANKIRSLLSFAAQVKRHRLLRVYSGPLKNELIKIGHDQADLLSIPFYLAPRLLEFTGPGPSVPGYPN